jgi:hypothetical protein
VLDALNPTQVPRYIPVLLNNARPTCADANGVPDVVNIREPAVVVIVPCKDPAGVVELTTPLPMPVKYSIAPVNVAALLKIVAVHGDTVPVND